MNNSALDVEKLKYENIEGLDLTYYHSVSSSRWLPAAAFRRNRAILESWVKEAAGAFSFDSKGHAERQWILKAALA